MVEYRDNGEEEEIISSDSEKAKKINKAVLKLIKKINKPQKFSLNKCFEDCVKNDDFRPLNHYLKSQIEKIGIQSFFSKINISPIKIRKALESKKPMNISLLYKILKALDLKLFIRKV